MTKELIHPGMTFGLPSRGGSVSRKASIIPTSTMKRSDSTVFGGAILAKTEPFAHMREELDTRHYETRYINDP